MSKTRTLTRGEIGLAEFHRIIGYASAVAALCLMGASITALYWFAGVIGLPTAAQVMVALAIEVMAASLAASATTAFRDGGKVDVTAWLGFAFFISIAAFANIMHVITYIDVSVAPTWFPTSSFVVAACVFAAACPLGGTWGVHRFGWLRAHGADAQWQADAQGRMVAPAPVARAPRTAQSPRKAPAQPARAESAQKLPESFQPVRATRTRTEGEYGAAEALFQQRIAQNPALVTDQSQRRGLAKSIWKELGLTCSESQARRWVQAWWEDIDAGTAADPIVAQVDAERRTGDAESVA